ncbi:hypothetical protein [Rhizobium sp. BK176]|uniref:hypothetical protein n=1 Tax=Rhizobium sp. BK176 TaxID=2587071 RepID=UPI002166CB86|nr:hypothetical protein [Rhizobium sp. BK176]MCS4088748.1 hypothetical protein [Rhizobium sp. BK176]
MTEARPSLHNRDSVIAAADMPTNLTDLCSKSFLFRGAEVPDQDYFISASRIEKDETGKVLEATLSLTNMENFEGVDFLIAERSMGGQVAILPGTPVTIIHSLPAFFETLTDTYKADFSAATPTVGMRM